MKKLVLFGAFILGFPVCVVATDLLDIYRLALENDTVFRNAYDTYMSSSEALPQARAALFPQVALANQAGRNVQLVADGLFSTHLYYGNTQWEVTASQAVFNYQAWAKVQQAKASVKAAQATFNDAAQNLILRTAKAYFDVLLAKDTLEFAQAKKRANKRQLDQATQRFNVGLDAITSVYEAQAAYDQSKATVISASNNQINQKENLRKLVDRFYENLAPLRNDKVPLIRPEPDDVNQWVDTGLRQNYKLCAARYATEIAKENLKSLSAGNWPVFSIQSNAIQIYNDKNTNNTLLGNSSVFVPAKQTQANVAIAMNFPVFQGGLVQSQTRQAQHNYRGSTELMEQAYREVVANSRIAFNTITDGISKVKADRQTVISQRNSLESTQAQFEVGTRTMVDVVNAQQRLFEAQQQLATDQYNLIYSMLTLKYLAGSLSVGDIELVNSWLVTSLPFRSGVDSGFK